MLLNALWYQILKKCGTCIEIILFSELSNDNVVLCELKIMCRFDDYDDYIVTFSMRDRA